MQNTVIHTNRLTLRPLLETDLHDFFEVVANVEAAREAGFHHARDLQEARYLLKQSAASPDVFAIVETRTEKVIGTIGLYKRVAANGEPMDSEREMGYVLNQEFWNRGLMTEAGQAMLEYAQKIGITVVWASFLDDNIASKRVLVKLGFTYHDTYEHPDNAIYLPGVTELFYRWSAE